MQPKQNDNLFDRKTNTGYRLLVIIVIRAAVLLLGINISDRLNLLSGHLGTLQVVQFFNFLTIFLTLLYLIGWYSRRFLNLQLYIQIGMDLILVTMLIICSSGDGPLVSLYLLIVIYSSLTLGKNGGLLGAALSALFYTGIVVAYRLDILDPPGDFSNTSLEIFRIGTRILSFWAVAYLGAYLHRRLHMVESVLKEKTDTLAKLQQLNEHIVRSIRSGLITTDLDGNIAVFNSAAGEITGEPANEVIGSSIRRIIGEDFWRRIRSEDLFQNAHALRHENWIQLPEGTTRYLGFSVSPLLDPNRLLLGYIISFQDLTEITRLEKEVRRKEHMATVGRMAAGIAHEIRNPLTAMRGSAEMLRARDNLPPKDERLLNILIRESDRLNEFIADFLNFARPQASPKTVIDLIPLLRDSVTLLKNSPEIIKSYFVHLKINVHSMNIHGNADQINQVFWNLAQNAIRAMPNGGNLTISIEKTPDGNGRIIFEDNGIGMSSEEIEQMFQPFHSGFSHGLGLGLSIVFQIMEDHKGKISFESEKEKGTNVILTFPLETPLIEPKGRESKG